MYSVWVSHSYEIDASADSSANNALKSRSYAPQVGYQVVMAIIQPLMESLNKKEGRSCELKTHELCITWRHHPQVIPEWNNIQLDFTCRTVIWTIQYGEISQ